MPYIVFILALIVVGGIGIYITFAPLINHALAVMP